MVYSSEAHKRLIRFFFFWHIRTHKISEPDKICKWGILVISYTVACKNGSCANNSEKAPQKRRELKQQVALVIENFEILCWNCEILLITKYVDWGSVTIE